MLMKSTISQIKNILIARLIIIVIASQVESLHDNKSKDVSGGPYLKS